MRRLLIITKHPRDLSALESVLVREGYRVSTCVPDEEAVSEVVSGISPEVLIVDCRQNSGLASEMRRMLASVYDIKELMAVALLTTEETPDMNWTGVDDFLIHPCNESELLARLSLLFWRTRKIDSDHTIKIGGLIIDMKNYEISTDGEPMEVTFKEYELLKFLATHRGRVFSRESLLNHVWGYDYYGGTRTIDVHIRRLRAKLGSDYEELIETVRNVGYRFTA